MGAAGGPRPRPTDEGGTCRPAPSGQPGRHLPDAHTQTPTPSDRARSGRRPARRDRCPPGGASGAAFMPGLSRMAASVSTSSASIAADAMLDQERPIRHLPQRHAPGQPVDQLPLGVGEAQQLPAGLGLRRRLAEHHPGLGVGQQTLGQPLLGRPAAPAARRSDRRCTTATLATPIARASLNVACSQRAVARSCSTAQASSTTTSRFGPPRRPGWPAASRWRRSSARPGPARRTPPTDRARPPERPGPSRARSARRTCRPGRPRPAGAAPGPPGGRRAARPAASVRTVAARAGSGSSRAATTPGSVGSAGPGRHGADGQLDRGALRRGERPAQRRRGQRADQLGPPAHEPASPAARRPAPGRGAGADPGPAPGGQVERVEAHDPPGASRSGVAPHASARAPYSPLGSTIHACRPNATWRQTNVLTNVDLPRPTWPRTSRFGLVSTPRRYRSHGSKQNDPPNRSRPISGPPAEPAFGDERIDRLEMRGRGPMGGRRLHGRRRIELMPAPGPAEGSRCTPPPAGRTAGAVRDGRVWAACSVSTHAASSPSRSPAVTVTYPEKRYSAWPSASSDFPPDHALGLPVAAGARQEAGPAAQLLVGHVGGPGGPDLPGGPRRRAPAP